MNGTLLCPGPSLANYGGQGQGIVVGVNRAATLYHCDVWAATDWTLIKRVDALGEPLLFTIKATLDAMKRKGCPWKHATVTHADITGQPLGNGQTPWARYTATAALQYLAWSGATHIDVWGADWAGREDWDGTTAKSDNRTTQRWKEEQSIWRGVIDANGLHVTRHR